MLTILLIACFLLALVLTGAYRRYALVHHILDVPNERSSHKLVTPRGGGVAIVIAYIAALLVMAALGYMDRATLYAMAVAPLLVAGIGFMDDRRSISMKWRLLVHFLAAFWLIYWLHEGRQIPVFEFDTVTGVMLFFITAVALVWLLNLYNFMDGIDGITASETIFVAVVLGVFAWLGGFKAIAVTGFVLAVATAGFLVFNWPPARLFMGDVGSGFLGITLGGLTFALSLKTGVVFPWLILFGVFVVDATLTLLTRMVRGERWYEAHRSHAYQYAAQRWGHLRVTIAVSVINCGWLLPMAWLAYNQSEHAALYCGVALLPLAILAIWQGAGQSRD